MNRNLSSDSSSTESDVFYVERSSEEGSPIRNITPAVLNFTEGSGATAAMAVIREDEAYNPKSPEPSDTSTISTPPMNLTTIEGWEIQHTTTDDKKFYSEG